MILELDGIHTYYDTSHILQGVSLGLALGEAVCLLGRNGAGKSTTLKSIIGLVVPRQGQVRFKGKDLTGQQPYRIARMGIGYVPEDRRIYGDLTVQENLEVAVKQGGKRGEQGWTVEKVFEVFPTLKKMEGRKGRQMSGGEQQMLTIARTLMGNPEVLLLDEPSEGLAPLIVATVGEVVARIIRQGMTVLLAEQNSVFALKLVQRAYVIEKGKIHWSGTVDEISANEEMRLRYLSI
jgi:branched-chain amino acid transport system ATP-binding protein